MSEETKAEPKANPAIVIGWDEAAKGVTLKWERSFSNFDFILAVLEMARLSVEPREEDGRCGSHGTTLEASPSGTASSPISYSLTRPPEE